MTVLTSDQREFVTSGATVAMITVGRDGYAKPVRVGVAYLDGVLCGTGTESRRRTARLRADPRCTLYFTDAQYRYLAVETTVSIVDGDAGVDGSMRLVRQWQRVPDDGAVDWFGETLEPDAFRQRLMEEGRVLYQFEVVKAYGLLGPP